MNIFKKDEIVFLALLAYAVISCKAISTLGVWESCPLLALAVFISALFCLAWDLRYMVNRWMNRKA